MMKVYRSAKAEKAILDTYDQLLVMWNVAKVERDIPTSYGSTHVIQCGDEGNAPLVLFHGVGDDSALMWLYNAKFLSERFCVYAVDTIGGPGKSRPGEAYDENFDDATWIDAVFDALRLDKAFVAGVSHGAYLAQYYGAHRPNRVEKMLCMAGSVPVGSGSPMKTMMKIFLPEALFPTEKNVAKLLRKLCGDNSEVFTGNPAVLAHYKCLLKGFNNMAMRYHKVESLADSAIDSIREKTLYLIGDDDPFAKLGGKDALLRYNMNAQFYPGVGHGINHEIAEEINRRIATWFLA